MYITTYNVHTTLILNRLTNGNGILFYPLLLTATCAGAGENLCLVGKEYICIPDQDKDCFEDGKVTILFIHFHGPKFYYYCP